MIAVDTSALVAILFREEEAADFVALIQANRRALIGAPTALELRMVVSGQSTSEVEAEAEAMLREPGFEIAPFGEEHFREAMLAFMRFGKGRGHRAGLNFGDCMAYAVAKVAGCPLLYKGDDFARTDIASAI